jgi:hypothetical protein
LGTAPPVIYPFWFRLHKFDKFRTIAEQDKLDAAALQSAELAGAAPDAKNPQAAFSASWNLPETRISALFRARKDPRVRAWIAGTEIEYVPPPTLPTRK